MKAQNLIRALAFVNESKRTYIISDGRNRHYGSHVVRQMPSHLSLSNRDVSSDYGSDHGENNSCDHSHRRKFVQTITKSFLMSVLLANVNPARAACLSGDIRAECIGVYRLPIDAAELSYGETPEKLKLYAPDLQWVPPVQYPSSYADALNQLNDQRHKLDDTQDLIAKGDIEKAGLVLLDVIPKVNAAGIVINKSFNEASNTERNLAMKKQIKSSNGNDRNTSSIANATTLEMKAYRIEYTLNELLGYLGETDILIGQGLRGDLGASAPAQIQILSNIADCRNEFGNLLDAIPEKVSIV